MRIKHSNIKLKHILGIFGFVALAGVGLVLIQKIVAVAQTGDFVNNIKTTLRTTDQQAGAEKTNFLSGETINLSTRVEVTSDGGVDAFPNAYLLIKVPKQNIHIGPTFTTTSAISSNVRQDTDTHYVTRFNYNNLQAGTINSINFNFSMRNPETPEGFKTEVVHELYDQGGQLLSRQTKTVATTKEQPVLNPYIYKTNGSENIQFIATYTDETNTQIDRDSFAKMGRVTYSYNNYTRYSNQGYGRRVVESARFISAVPQHMEVSAESLAEGWVYDEHSRQAVLQLRDGAYQENKKYPLTLVFKKDTPESVFADNYRVTNRLKVELNFVDKTTASAQSVHQLQVKPLRRTNEGNIKFSKSVNQVYGSDSNSKIVDGVKTNVYNINQEPRVYWDVRLDVVNTGSGQDAPISSVFDNLPEPMLMESVNLVVEGVKADEVGFGEIEVFGHKKTGEKDKIANFAGNNLYISANETDKYAEYNKIEFKFRDGFKLPAVINGLDKYSLRFGVSARFRDRKAFADSIPAGAKPTAVINRATAEVNNGQLLVESPILFDRQAIEAKNDITISKRKPILTVGDRVNFERFNVVSPKVGRGVIKPSSLKDYKAILLFPKELELDAKLIERIKAGDAQYIYNYKNTGKSALVASGQNSKTDFLIDRFFPSNMFKVSEFIPDGQHEIELITYWSDSDTNYTGTAGLDDLDFNDDGLASVNVARSKSTFSVVKPEQVGIKKYVRNLETPFQNQIDDLDPGQAIEYSLAVINTSDRPLNSSRILEVLPLKGDKKIVEGNNGIQADRGSTTEVRLTKSIPAQNGFTILYSTEEPGANQAETWSKKFVTEAEVNDWSKIRMVKIQQNPGHVVDPQTVIRFTLSAKISDNSADGSRAINTAAVAISETGNLVESDPVVATVKYPSEIRGIAFEDVNGNSIFDQGVDKPLEGYLAEIVRPQSDLIGHGKKVKTGLDGRYKFNFKDDGSSYAIKFTKNSEDLAIVPVRGGSSNNPAGSTIAPNSNNLTSLSYTFSPNSRTRDVNIGVFRPRGSVIVKLQTVDGVELAPDFELKKYALINEPYTVNRPQEINDKNGLKYEFAQLASGSDAETGVVEEKIKTVIVQYRPKAGGSVKAQYLVEQTGKKVAADTVIKPSGTQVGTPYTATKQNEIEFEGLVYVFEKLKSGAGSSLESGVVSESDQIVTYYYLPKAGGAVVAEFVDSLGNKLKPDIVVKPNNSQVGAEYSVSPDNELTVGGITYVYKQLKSDSAAASGRVEPGEKKISFVYEQKKGGQVIATYVDKTGRAISGSKDVAAGNTPVGTNYADNPPAEITDDNGLVFIFDKTTNDSAPNQGKVSETTQIIKYQYSPKPGSEVVARFVDQNGKQLADDVEVQPSGSQIGKDYQIAPTPEITKDGLVYEFDKLAEISPGLNGKVSAEAKVVTIIYKPKLGARVVLKIVDGNGKEISSTKILQPDGKQIGTPFEFEPQDKIEVDGKIYQLKPNQKPIKGRVSLDPQELMLVYVEQSQKISAPSTGWVRDSKLDLLTIVLVAVGLLGSTVLVSKKI